MPRPPGSKKQKRIETSNLHEKVTKNYFMSAVMFGNEEKYFSALSNQEPTTPIQLDQHAEYIKNKLIQMQNTIKKPDENENCDQSQTLDQEIGICNASSKYQDLSVQSDKFQSLVDRVNEEISEYEIDRVWNPKQNNELSDDINVNLYSLVQ